MLNSHLLRALAVMILLSACSRPVLPSSDPQPLPSPPGSWTISLTQSGGFAGVMLKVDVSSDGQLKAEDQRSGQSVTQTLPPATVAKLTGLYSAVLLATPESPHSGCADCFLYDLQLGGDGRVVQIHADDTTLAGSGAAGLIGLLQELRDNALRTQP